MERESDAFDDLEKLLNENPDYPDKLGIYKKLLPLAQKLGRKTDAEKYEEQLRLLTPPPIQPTPK